MTSEALALSQGRYSTIPSRIRISLAVFLASAALATAQAVKKSFDLPASSAEKTLRLFSAQSGLPVLFPTDLTKGVRTHAVRGEFLPREALDKMLAGTVLVAVQDEKTGSLTIRHHTDPNGAGAAPPTADEHSRDSQKKNESKTRQNQEPMKRNKLLSKVATALALLVAPADPADAQTVPAATDPAAEEKAIELSPFVVSSERDTGYQATNTLAGTRLNTSIKDIPAAVSIYTKDFLNDIGAVDSNDLLIYATGMEAGGPGGNFSAFGNDINLDRPTNDAARVEPQGSGSRSRGLAGPTFTRDYFITGIAFDSYNTSTVTVNRGPNAALFGTGSAAGVVNTALESANLNRNTNRLSFRYGNNKAMRHTVDLNRVLIPKKLAARVILLRDNERYNQKPAFQDKKRVYGTVNFQPFRSTSFRGNFESGNTYANRPLTLPPLNNVSAAWMAAGRPGYDWTFYDDPAKNPAAASIAAGPVTEGNLIGIVNVSGQIIVYANPTDIAPSNAFAFRNRTTSAYAANAIASQIFHPVVNRDQATDTITFVYTRGMYYLPAAYWTGANVPPGQQPGFVPVGMKAQSFSDYSAFDWRNRIIDESSRQSDSFRTFNLSFSQTAWEERIGVEVAFDRQRIDRRAKNSFFDFANSGQIAVDVSRYLPSGELNSNYGRPFVGMTTAQWRDFEQESESHRATAYLKYDFRDVNSSWTKWLGRHTLTGLYQKDGGTRVSYSRRVHTGGAASERADAGNIFASARRPSVIVYLGPSIIGNENPLRLESVRIPEIKAGPTAPISDFARAANQTDPGSFVSEPAWLVDVVAGGAAQREVIKSRAAVLQSYWLGGDVITTASWRRDENFFAREPIGFVANPNDRNDPGKAFFGLKDFSFPGTPPPGVSKEITSFGAVVNWPRRLVRLPRGIDFGVFYNKSSNFTPIGGRVNHFAEPYAPPEGNTKEYGLNFSALDGKLNIRLNRFDTAVQGISAAPSFFSALRNGTLGIARNWAQHGNTNPHLAEQSNADIELLFSALPPNFRELYNFVVTGTPPNVAASVNTVAFGATDTVDSRAKGVEADITYNVTKNWRILLNVANQETKQVNQYPFSKHFIARMKPVWDMLSSRPEGNYPAGFQHGDTLPANVRTYGQYLDLNVYVPFASATATEGSASAEQRKWRANFVTNYSFDQDSIFGGRLKGVGVGGAVRWQDKLGIGYPSSREPNGTAHFDIGNPFYAPAVTNVDAWVSYTRKIWNGRIGWKVQLNAINVVGTKSLIPVLAQSWSGEVAQYRVPPERRWYVTNTFTF